MPPSERADSSIIIGWLRTRGNDTHEAAIAGPSGLSKGAKHMAGKQEPALENLLTSPRCE